MKRNKIKRTLSIIGICFILGVATGFFITAGYYKAKIEKTTRRVYEGFENSYEDFGNSYEEFEDTKEEVKEKTKEELERLDSMKVKGRQMYEDTKSFLKGLGEEIMKEINE